jgi:prolyl-tRNA synthetase
VLLDDRKDVSPGVKFNDSELIGVPTIVVVGKRLADGVVEIRDRKSGDKSEISVDAAVAEIVSAVRA